MKTHIGFRTVAWATTIFLTIHLITTQILAAHDGSDDPLDWLRESIPGEPAVDYPIFSEVQTTSFSCKDRVYGGKNYLNLTLNNPFH